MTRSEPPADVIEADELPLHLRAWASDAVAEEDYCIRLRTAVNLAADLRRAADEIERLRASSSLGGIEGGVARPVTACAPQVQDGEIKALSSDLLGRIRAFLVDHHDVVDGPPGYEHEQRPNLAMSLSIELDEEMGVRP